MMDMKVVAWVVLAICIAFPLYYAVTRWHDIWPSTRR